MPLAAGYLPHARRPPENAGQVIRIHVRCGCWSRCMADGVSPNGRGASDGHAVVQRPTRRSSAPSWAVSSAFRGAQPRSKACTATCDGKFDIGLRGGVLLPAADASTVVLAVSEARVRESRTPMGFPAWTGALMVGAERQSGERRLGAHHPGPDSRSAAPIDSAGDPPSASCRTWQTTSPFIVGDFRSACVGFGVGADFPAVPRARRAHLRRPGRPAAHRRCDRRVWVALERQQD